MIRYNPCGRVVDIGRDAGKINARLYPDDPTEYEIEWYVAAPGAPLLGCPSAVNSLAWEKDRLDWLPTGVGEVPGSNFRKRRNTPKLIAIGRKRCGTEADFAGDGHLNTQLPPVVYLPSGLPLCCGGLFEGAGGLGLSGSATVTYQGPVSGIGGVVLGGVVSHFYTPAPTGGVVLGGTADVQYSGELEGSGGVVLGGAGDVSYTLWLEGIGGLALSGQADWSYQTAETGSGGLALGGTADQTYNPPASGGVVLGGTADQVYAVWIAGSGGVVLGGVATIYAGALYTGSGGLALGGTADKTYVTEQDATGGIVLGGSADVTYTPPTPTPGSTCATAAVVALGTTNGATISGSLTQQWWQITTLTNGVTYYISTSGVSISQASFQTFEGTTCAGQTNVFTSNPHANCYSFTKTGTNSLWLEFHGPFSGSATYTFNVSTTPC